MEIERVSNGGKERWTNRDRESKTKEGKQIEIERECTMEIERVNNGGKESEPWR